MADLKQKLRVEATFKDGVSRGLDGIRDKSEKSLGSKTGLASHAGMAKVAIAGLAAGAVAAAVSISRMVTSVARQNDEIAKLSTRLGASTEALSQLKFVAERSGVSFATFTMGLQRMTRRVAEAAQGTGESVKALKELGIEARALSRLAPEDQFSAIAEEISKVNSASDRVRLAMKLFDSEGVALVQTMTEGAAGIAKLRKEADTLGLTLTGSAAREAEEFQDKITNITGAVDGLTKAFAEGAVGELNKFETTIGSASMRQSAESFGGVIGALAARMWVLGEALSLVYSFRTMSPPKVFAELADKNASPLFPGSVDQTSSASRSATLRQLASIADPSNSVFKTTGGAGLLGLRKSGLADVSNAGAPVGTASISQGSSAIPQLLNGGPSAVKAGEIAGQGFTLGFGKAVNAHDQGVANAGSNSSVLGMLAFGGSNSSADSIDRISDRTGDRAAAKVLQGWKTRTAKDAESDITIPFADVASTTGERFVGSLNTSLQAGLTDLILNRDFGDALKVFGANMGVSIALELSGELADKITDKVKDLGKDKSTEDFIEAGKGIGKHISSGFSTGFDGVSSSITETLDGTFGGVADSLGLDGAAGKKISGALGDALVGGVVGAGIGKLVGGEITTEAAAIGGALGGALAGPVGSIVGSIVGAVASKVPVIGGALDQLLGVSDAKEVQNFGTDVRAFGGLEGYFERIGGLEGIRGDRAKDIIGNDDLQNAIRDLVRLEAGATRSQAEDVVQVLKSAGVRNQATARGEIPGFAPGAPAISRNRKSSESELRNILAAIGISQEQIDSISFNTDAPMVPVDPPVVSVVAPVTPVTPVGGGNTKRVESGNLFDDFFADADNGRQRLSVSEGGARLDSGQVSLFIEQMGASIGSPKGNNILNLIKSRGRDQGARQYLSEFYDIVARNGYHGMVNRPTTILAGEAGPERIDIGPSAGFQGGASNGRQTVIHFNVNVNSLDPRGVRDLMQGEVGDMLLERIRESSIRGETVIYNTGVATPPRV